MWVNYEGGVLERILSSNCDDSFPNFLPKDLLFLLFSHVCVAPQLIPGSLTCFCSQSLGRQNSQSDRKKATEQKNLQLRFNPSADQLQESKWVGTKLAGQKFLRRCWVSDMTFAFLKRRTPASQGLWSRYWESHWWSETWMFTEMFIRCLRCSGCS